MYMRGKRSTHKIISLRMFITLAICLTVTVILVLSGLFYYNKTAGILMENYERSFTSQLSQVNQKISDQIAAVILLRRFFCPIPVS